MGALLQDGLADGTVGRNKTLTLTLGLVVSAQWRPGVSAEISKINEDKTRGIYFSRSR
jgi:hypothetical protein